MRRRPSIIYEACVRFDSLKAIGVSRHAAKCGLAAAASARGDRPLLAPSTGRIHADKTLDTYKGIALQYVHWARATHGLHQLADLDVRAEDMVARYLDARQTAGDSASTLKTIRSALRMFHRPAYPLAEREERARALGATVRLPLRRRAEITRSRGPVAMDREIALDHYQDIVAFCRATGLRRRELGAVVVGAVHAARAGGLAVTVCNGKGGKRRVVPVLPGQEEAVGAVVRTRPADACIFPRIPVRLDVHSYRRWYAQQLYADGGRYPLPSPLGRLAAGSIDLDRARYVAQALGHARSDIVVRHYLR